MLKLSRSTFLFLGSALLTFLAGLLVLGPRIFATDGFEPHGYCFLWQPGLLWLLVGSDFLIGASYVAISLTLAYLVYQTRHDIPFRWMLLAFGAFIIACGFTHFLDVWTVWIPMYWLAGNVKLVTAMASVATAVALPPLVPRVLDVIDTAKISQERKRQLELANTELELLYTKIKELDELKSQFFANVSHELRTPLTLILGPTQQLLVAGGLDDVQRHTLTVVERNAQTLLKHVNDLLDIATFDAGKLVVTYATVDYAQLVRQIASQFELLAQEREVAYLIETPETAAGQADAEKVQRVLVNLLANAFKFTPVGGTIRAALNATDTNIELVVADSGPGVPPALRGVIFERFRQGEGGATRRFGGTGLGLAIAKEFVEALHGHIRVNDAPEGGAQFLVDLPRTAPASLPVGASAALPDRALALVEQHLASLDTHSTPTNAAANQDDQPLVLIVEDNADMRGFIANTLAATYQVATAGDGQAGLDQAAALRPDLILTDMMMPVMSGEQLIEELQAHAELAAIPIILLTAKADDALRVRMLRNGAHDYLIKPFAPQELQVRVQNLIAMKRAREVLQQALDRRDQDVASLANQVVLRSRELEQALEREHATATENARLYQEARDALRLRDQFLSIAAHELKTPLTILLGNVHLLQRWATREGSLNERDLRAIHKIGMQAERLSMLIGAMLDLSRLETGQFHLEQTRLDLGALVQRVLEDMQPMFESHAMAYAAPDNPLLVLGDAVRLEQVLQNLLHNAIKYSPLGGTITVHLARADGMARIEVIDQGIGIPQNVLPNLFTRFYRAPNVDYRNISGIGIGLYIVKEIVVRHGGWVEVQTAEGHGSTFRVFLPEPDADDLFNNQDARTEDEEQQHEYLSGR